MFVSNSFSLFYPYSRNICFWLLLRGTKMNFFFEWYSWTRKVYFSSWKLVNRPGALSKWRCAGSPGEARQLSEYLWVLKFRMDLLGKRSCIQRGYFVLWKPDFQVGRYNRVNQVPGAGFIQNNSLSQLKRWLKTAETNQKVQNKCCSKFMKVQSISQNEMSSTKKHVFKFVFWQSVAVIKKLSHEEVGLNICSGKHL